MSTKAENDLVGYLTENRIESAECDMNHSFAFISYAHTVHDMDIVRYVFEELTRRGYNLWLDAAKAAFVFPQRRVDNKAYDRR